MKFAISEVFSDGAVVTDVRGLEFGIGKNVLPAIANGLEAMVQGKEAIHTGRTDFTNGRYHPLAMMFGAVEKLNGAYKAYHAGSVDRDGESLEMALIVIENGDNRVALAYIPVDSLNEVKEGSGAFATFSICVDDASAIVVALREINHEGLPTQEEAYAAKEAAQAE